MLTTRMMTGSVTLKSLLGICHAVGIVGEETKIVTRRMHIAFVSQKCLRILGSSTKKLDRSTSFFVAPKVIGNDNV